MFIKRDNRKIPEILEEETAIKQLKLGRRQPEFRGSTALLFDPANAGKLADLELLSLYHCQIASLDHFDTLVRCTKLTALNLGRNKITSLPAEIGSLKSLKRLWIDDNELTALPPSICELSKLEVLEASGNRLTALPAGIEKLTTLRELSLENNALTELPPAVCRLPALEALLLRRNRLTALPDAAGEMVALRELHVNSNALTSLPASLGKCARLEVLMANTNAIDSVPPSLASLPSLTLVSLAHNKIAALPSELAHWLPCTDDDGEEEGEAGSGDARGSRKGTSRTAAPEVDLEGNLIVQTEEPMTATQFSQPVMEQLREAKSS